MELWHSKSKPQVKVTSDKSRVNCHLRNPSSDSQFFNPQVRFTKNWEPDVSLEMVPWHLKFKPQVRFTSAKSRVLSELQDQTTDFSTPKLNSQKLGGRWMFRNGTLTFRIQTPGKIYKREKPRPLRTPRSDDRFFPKLASTLIPPPLHNKTVVLKL